MDVREYLSGPEGMRRRELVWGVVREPPSPVFNHQAIITQMTHLLKQHVDEHGLGVICVSPMDVVLDEQKALIVQPDILFISNDRRAIIRDQIWGAPDLVVEVASAGTTRYDRTSKVEWYRTYGVRECWLVDPKSRAVTIVGFQAVRDDARRRFAGEERVQSAVLPALANTADEFFR